MVPAATLVALALGTALFAQHPLQAQEAQTEQTEIQKPRLRQTKHRKKAAEITPAQLVLNAPDKKTLCYSYILGFNRHAALGNHDDCSRLLKKICEHNPNFSSATVLDHLLSTNQFEAVVKTAENHRNYFGPDEWHVNFCAARALSFLKRDGEAEKMFHEASRTAKKTWDKEQTTYAQAIFYIQNNKMANALRELDAFLNSTPPRAKHALFYFLKGTIHLNGKHPQYELALAQLNKGLELNPHFERALKLKALVLEQQDKKPELIAVLKQIIELDPQPALTKRLVSLLFEEGSFDQAYTILSNIEEKTADHFYDLALISWKLRNNERALGHIDTAIKLNAEFARARLLRLEILLGSDRKPEALSHLKSWILHGKDPKAFSTLSMLTGSGTITPHDALAVLQPLQNNTATHKEVHSFLGDLHALTGNYKAAEKSYRSFLRSLGKHDKTMGLKAMYNLGFLQWRQGNIKEALAEVSRAHSVDQKNALITNFLAFLYTQQEDRKKVQKAKQLLQHAQAMEAGEDHVPHLPSLLAAQEEAYKLSPFWANLASSRLHPEAPALETTPTSTQNSHLSI